MEGKHRAASAEGGIGVLVDGGVASVMEHILTPFAWPVLSFMLPAPLMECLGPGLVSRDLVEVPSRALVSHQR